MGKCLPEKIIDGNERRWALRSVCIVMCLVGSIPEIKKYPFINFPSQYINWENVWPCYVFSLVSERSHLSIRFRIAFTLQCNAQCCAKDTLKQQFPNF